MVPAPRVVVVLRIEYASLRGWVGGLVIAILEQLAAAGARRYWSASQRQPAYPHPATGVAHEAVSLPALWSAARVTGPARASPGHERRPGGS